MNLDEVELVDEEEDVEGKDAEAGLDLARSDTMFEHTSDMWL